MNTSMLTLRDLFTERASHGPTQTPVPSLARFVGGLEWQGLYEHVFDVLEVSIVDILVGGWRKHAEVRTQLKATAADPSRTALVHLARHTLRSSHTPSIQIRSGGASLATIAFSVDVSFDIAAVELTLRRGEIEVIRPGEVTVRGTVKVENAVILERAAGPIVLPGRIALARLESADEPGGDPRSLGVEAVLHAAGAH